MLIQYRNVYSVWNIKRNKNKLCPKTIESHNYHRISLQSTSFVSRYSRKANVHIIHYLTIPALYAKLKSSRANNPHDRVQLCQTLAGTHDPTWYHVEGRLHLFDGFLLQLDEQRTASKGFRSRITTWKHLGAGPTWAPWRDVAITVLQGRGIATSFRGHGRHSSTMQW